MRLSTDTAITSLEPTMPGERQSGFTPPLLIALAIGIVLRVFAPDSFPPPALDEGGWPYSVRAWAQSGAMTYDFHTAPGYHLILGAAFELAEPTLLTARVLSGWLSVLALVLFWWAVKRTSEDPQIAAWSTVLWATCFPAIDIARRALIEPIQMVFITGLLCALALTRRRTAFVCTALATAGLLLTKANAVVLLPAFALALWWDRSPALSAERRAKLAGMVSGVALTALAFILLYRLDPETFVRGWSPTLAKTYLESTAPILRFGRFVLDPQLIQSGLDFIAAQTPFLFVFGLTGALRSARDRDASLGGFWALVLLPFLLLQVWQSPQYFSVLYPAFAIGAGGLLVSTARRVPGRLSWPVLALALVVVDGLGRATAAMLVLDRPDAQTVGWLRERVPSGERVIAAPFLLMQLPEPTVSMFELPGPPFAPDTARLRELGAQWIVIDRSEWQQRLARARIDSASVADGLRECCTLVRSDDYAWIYRMDPPSLRSRPAPAR